MSADKPVILTITVQPAKGSKRPIVVAGAIEGRMPVIRTGVFADLHTLVDDVYIDASTRKAAAPKKTGGAKAKAKPTHKSKPKTKPDQLDRGGADVHIEIEPTDDALVIRASETADEALPVIEGDDDGQLNLLEVDSDD